MNYSASEWIKLFLHQPLPELTDAPTILAENNNAGIATPEIFQVLEEEDIYRTEAI